MAEGLFQLRLIKYTAAHDTSDINGRRIPVNGVHSWIGSLPVSGMALRVVLSMQTRGPSSKIAREHKHFSALVQVKIFIIQLVR